MQSEAMEYIQSEIDRIINEAAFPYSSQSKGKLNALRSHEKAEGIWRRLESGTLKSDMELIDECRELGRFLNKDIDDYLLQNAHQSFFFIDFENFCIQFSEVFQFAIETYKKHR